MNNGARKRTIPMPGAIIHSTMPMPEASKKPNNKEVKEKEDKESYRNDIRNRTGTRPNMFIGFYVDKDIKSGIKEIQEHCCEADPTLRPHCDNALAHKAHVRVFRSLDPRIQGLLCSRRQGTSFRVLLQGT